MTHFLKIFFVLSIFTISSAWAEETVTPEQADLEATKTLCKRLVTCSNSDKTVESCIDAVKSSFDPEKTKDIKIPKSYLDECINDFNQMTCDTLMKGPADEQKVCEKLNGMLTPLQSKASN